MNQEEGLRHAKSLGKFDKHQLSEDTFTKVFDRVALLTNIDWNCKAVLSYILRWEIYNGKCTSTNNQLCANLGLSIKQLRRSLNILKGVGYLKLYIVTDKTTKMVIERRLNTITLDVDNAVKHIEENYEFTEV